MIKLKIARLLELEIKELTNIQVLNQEFTGCYASDLLSNVLAKAKNQEGLLTTLSNMNVIAVASLLNLPFVLFLEGKMPNAEMIEKAEEEEIILLSTKKNCVETILMFHKEGIL